MTLFYAIAAGLCVLAAALLARPLWWPFGRRPGLTQAVRQLAQQLKQLGELHRAGALTDEQYAQSKALLERKVLDAMVEPSDAAANLAPAKPSTGLAAAIVAFMFVTAAGGYYWLGSPGNLEVGPGAAPGSPAAGGGGSGVAQGDGAHALNAEQVSAMIAQLAERLKSKPDDAEGWQMLARSNIVIGKHAQAIEAFKEASRLRPDDANLLADYADALAMTNNRSLDGEPAKLIERALKVEPNNPKALALAGTAAFDRHDYKLAVQQWERLVRVEPADGPFAQQVQGSIAEARQLAGMSPAASPVVDATAPAALAQVSGTVTLAPTLKGRVAPDDTLFVFARAVDGPRMPLGIVRKRVSDLPLQFTIDDSMAMSPDAKLSSASRVVVGARISKSGNARAQSGDYQGLSPAVAVGSAGLKLVIDQEVSQ